MRLFLIDYLQFEFMIRTVITLCIFSISLGKVLQTKPQRSMEVELGQAYSQNIPLLFKRFQHSKLVKIGRDEPYYQSPICDIRLASPGTLRQISELRHDNQTQNRTIRPYGQQIVFQFEQLKGLRTFIDAIHFEQMLVALYQKNKVIIYKIGKQNGQLQEHLAMEITGEAIVDGQFVINQGNILLLTPRRAFQISADRTYKTVEGYQQIVDSIEDIHSVQNHIFIAAGDKGIFTYKYDALVQRMELISNATFYDQTEKFNTTFDVNRLQIDAVSRMVYILDREQGVISASLDKIIGGGKVKAHELRVLMGGCENIIITSSNIYLTCPQLLKLNRQSGAIERRSRNSFYAYEMDNVEQRLLLYGHREVAVYDILGNIAEEFALSQIAEKSFIINNYLIVFSDNTVSSYFLISQQQKLYCYTASQNRAGTYNGIFSTSGLCSEYFEAPQTNNDNCEVQYPFKIKIKNSLLVDYKLQLIAFGVYILVSGIIALVLVIRQHIIHKSYNQLVEEESKEHIQAVPPIEMKKSRQQQVAQ